MTKLIGYNLNKNNLQINLFPIYLFCMWQEKMVYINITFLFVTLGFKIDLYDNTYM